MSRSPSVVERLRRGPSPTPESVPEGPPIVLVGNANVGKSVLFRNLTRRYVTVSNYPGTTVEIARATAAIDAVRRDVIDTPGIHDLSPRSEDARVTLDLLDAHPDATLVQVADAKNLRRSLLLTLQLAALGRPMVLVLNMLDELEERGGSIDVRRLEAILGIPVVEAVAVQNRGTDTLLAALDRARVPEIDDIRIATDDPYEANRARIDRVNEILTDTYEIRPPEHPTLRTKLGFWAMDPLRGLAILGVVLATVFWFVGLFGAGTLVDLMETGLFEQRVSPAAIRVVDAALPFPHTHAVEGIEHTIGVPITPVHEWTVGTLSERAIVPDYTSAGELGGWQEVLRFLHDLLVGEYGMVTMALAYAFAIVLPIVTTFFLVFGILEDSGYFPRMAIMMNKVFRAMGLNGKAVLPMILGLGCDTMATMTTRILETKRDRIITTLLLALAVPCSAQLGVLLALTTALSPGAALLWAALMVGVIFLVGWLSARLFGGPRSDFVLEVPPLRRPQLSNVVAKTLGRLEWYLKEVIPLFVLGTLVLFLLDEAHLLGRIATLGEPIVVGWLGLPVETTNAFLVGFLRRDFGAVYILDAATGPGAVLSPHQIFVAMVTITLFVPCFANVLMIAREHGARIALRMVGFIFPFAFFVGGLVHHLGRWLGGVG